MRNPDLIRARMDAIEEKLDLTVEESLALAPQIRVMAEEDYHEYQRDGSWPDVREVNRNLEIFHSETHRVGQVDVTFSFGRVKPKTGGTK